MKRLAAICFAAIGLAGPLLAVQPPGDEPAKALRDSVMKATTPEAKAKAYKAWFTAVGRAGLPALTKDADTGIALQAAWEVHKKPAVQERTHPVVGQVRTYDSEGLKSFLQFLGERTNAPVPVWWADEVRDVWVPGDSHGFGGAGRFKGWGRKDATAGKDIVVTEGADLARRGGRLVYAAGGREVECPGSDVPVRPGDAINGVLADDGAALAVSSPDGGFPVAVYGFGPKGGRPTWSATAWGAGRTALAGQAPHRVDLVEKGGTVFVFGAEPAGAYVEGFDLRTGRCQFRFCSCYWFNFSEAWGLK